MCPEFLMCEDTFRRDLDSIGVRYSTLEDQALILSPHESNPHRQRWVVQWSREWLPSPNISWCCSYHRKCAFFLTTADHLSKFSHLRSDGSNATIVWLARDDRRSISCDRDTWFLINFQWTRSYLALISFFGHPYSDWELAHRQKDGFWSVFCPLFSSRLESLL